MPGGRAIVSLLSVTFVLACAAWATPQTYVGAYQGLFPDVVQTLISLTIWIALLVWLVRLFLDAVAAKAMPWRGILLVLGSFVGAEIVWRLCIRSLPGRDFKLAWVAMLYLQPAVAALGLLLFARILIGRRSRKPKAT